MRASLPLLLLLTAGSAILAQESPVDSAARSPLAPGVERLYARIGAFGGLAFNRHETEASIFTGGGECGAFENGTGMGPFGGLLVEVPIYRLMVEGVASVAFVQRGGEFGQVVTGGLPILAPTTNRYTQLERKHSYTASLGMLQSEVGVKVTPLEEYPFYLRALGAVAFPILQPTHTQTEEILSPSGVLYPENNQVVREVSSGEITDVEPQLAVGGALGYPVRLTPLLTIAPEVAWYQPLSDVTPHYPWRISALHAGAVARYDLGYVPPPPAPPPPPVVVEDRPVEPTPPQVAVASLAARRLDLEETIVTETFPVLPYIFFDSASAELHPRYSRLVPAQRSRFDERSLPHRSLGAYYEILNLIGRRLQDLGESRITLSGTTDGREQPVVGAARNLARARAQSVKDYLVKVWEIDPGRISVSGLEYPTLPSSMEYAEGAEENRRVEITSSDDRLLQPIVFERFSEYAFAPTEIPFRLSAQSDAGIESWHLEVYAGGMKVWERRGRGTLPDTLLWKLDQEGATRLAEGLGRGEGMLQCELSVAARNGADASAEALHPVERSLNPFEVSRLSLIVFDFDRADISQQNRRMVSSFIAGSLKPTSTASVIGSTDRLGEFDHNQQLSQGRAKNVADLVRRERPEATITKVEGIGPSRLLYDNALPEGRYYCRTVSVEVKTPLPVEGVVERE